MKINNTDDKIPGKKSEYRGAPGQPHPLRQASHGRGWTCSFKQTESEFASVRGCQGVIFPSWVSTKRICKGNK